MQEMSFLARCDVEIGDEVTIKFDNSISKIVDIRTASYLKSGLVEFEFSLEAIPTLWLKREAFVYPIVKR